MDKMKKFIKLLAMPLVLLILIISLPSIALAATGTQDGITVELTTDKTSYSYGEVATLTKRVTNTNAFPIDNVKVDLILPDGLRLRSGEMSVDLGTLEAGESRDFIITAATTGTTHRPPHDVPQTGVNRSILPWVILFIGVSWLVIVIVFRKKILNTISKTFMLILCSILALSMIAPDAAAQTVTRYFSVQESIRIGTSTQTITVTTTYDWDESNDSTPSPDQLTVTMLNDGNGTASATPSTATQGETVEIDAYPNNGFQFKEWQVVSGGVTISPNVTTHPATFTMPNSDVSIIAVFEPVPANTPNLVLTPSPVAFGSIAEGDSLPAARTVNIHNGGTAIANVTSIALGGANPGAFTLVGAGTPSIAINGDSTFTVQPNAGLAVGTYNATITVTYGGGEVTPGGRSTYVNISFTVNTIVNAQTPNITVQPQSHTVIIMGFVRLSVTANSPDGGTLSYQWYRNTTNSTAGGTPVGTNNASYDPNTGVLGTHYYYVVVTNTNTGVNGNTTATAASNTATVTVNPLPIWSIETVPFRNTTHTFTDTTPLTVTVTNTGNQPTENLTVSLGGANASSFTISTTGISSIDVNGSDSFTVEPNIGLSAGTYTATVTVDGTPSPQTFNVTFTVH
jgi:hypothetical protein